MERFKQPLLFDGMKYGSITPTDGDAVIEYHNKAWLWYEVKRIGKPVDTGQQLLMERFVRDMKECGKDAVAVVCEHNIYRPTEPVYLKDCLVREIFYDNNRWRQTKKPMDVKTFTDAFIEHVDTNF